MFFQKLLVRAAFAGVIFLFSCAAIPPLHPVITPQSKSFIDPAITYGALPNGFQYILKKNSTPIDRVSIHLNVFAGSMNEIDEQQGVAHFLEHMLFNGSEHFGPGELARYFPSIGMDFGADANAHTTFFNTVYDLALPSGDRKQMDEAFLIIQDYAKGALLLESEVKREQGIILAEKRERDSVSYRTFKEKLRFELKDSLIPQRFPIGTSAVIAQADQALLKSFYDKWYNPENLVLIVVGDFDVPEVESMISQRFSKLKPGLSSLDNPALTKWTPHKGVKAFYHYEPEAGSTEIEIATLTWEPFKAQTPQMLKKQVLSYISNSMLQNRLSRMIAKQKADFSSASVFSGIFLRHISMSSISATCASEQWEKGLSQIDNALRQALLYGFEQKELDRVKADYIAYFEQQFDQAQTQKTKVLAKRILSDVNKKNLLLSAEQKKRLLVPYIESVTLEDAHDLINEMWAKDHRLVTVTGNAKIDSKRPGQAILDIYNTSSTQAPDPYKGFESQAFPYLDTPAFQVKITRRLDNVNSLGLSVVDFDNNVRLNVKKTDYKQNKFSFKVCFGSGRMSEASETPGLSYLAQEVVDSSGFGRMDMDQLEDALAGRKVEISFNIRDTYFSLSGSADPKEASLVFDLISHYFNDTGYRNEALNLSKTKYQQQYDAMIRTPQGAMKIKGDLFLAGNNSRFGLPHPDLTANYTLDDIKNWLSPFFKNSPVEISIAGDIDPEKIITLASKYAGHFKNRGKFSVKQADHGKINFPSGETLEIELDTKIKSGVVRVAFLTDDFWDIKQTRRLSILSRVFSERLRLLIREELGETYSPYAYNDPSTSFENYGVMHVVVNVNSDSHEFVWNKIKEIIDSMLEKGISKEEINLALKPVLNHIQTLRRTNGYWLNSVMSNSSKHPDKLKWAKNMEEDYASINDGDLAKLAKKYLRMDKSAKIIIKSN